MAAVPRVASRASTGLTTNSDEAVAITTPAIIGQANSATAGPPHIAMGNNAANVVPDVKMQRASI